MVLSFFFFFQRNLKELARKAMEMCLRVLKESNKSRFDSYSRQEQCIDHIPYYLSGLSRAQFMESLTRLPSVAQKRLCLSRPYLQKPSVTSDVNRNAFFLNAKLYLELC